MDPRDDRLGANILRSWSPLLVGDVMRVGDVILSREPTPESALLADATGGQYSHASLWIGPGCLVEADGLGVGETFLAGHTVVRKGAALRVYRLTRSISDLLVLRLAQK